MALFSRKKNEEAARPDAAGAGGARGGGSGDSRAKDGGYEFSPEKAQRFFERAATLHETAQYEYGMNMWLSGLRFEPTSRAGLEGFFRSAGAFMNTGAKGPGKDLLKLFDRSGTIDRYLMSLLQWSAHPVEAPYAVRALELAAELGLAEPAVWIGERALGAAEKDKRPRQEHFIKIMEVMRRFGRFDLAVRAGEAALRLNPTDGRLAAEIRNMSAESTMSRGGFSQTGESGGFRQNIRDADTQRRLEEQDRVVKTEETLNRLITQTQGEYAANKLDKPTINRYVELLRQRGAPGDEERAVEVLEEAYKGTQEFRFLDLREQIRLKHRRQQIVELKRAADGGDAEAAERLKAAVKEYREAEIALAEAQVKAYPTDLARRFDLGRKLFEAGRYEEAIGQFQEAKGDPKNRANVLHYLGLAFQKIGYNDEAIDTLRQALSMHHSADDATGMELRYALMEALLARGAEMNDLADAEDSYKIAREIAMQQINYKQIRTRREEVKQLVARLKGGAGGGGPPPQPATGAGGGGGGGGGV
ncbi:MAG: hypothetical protein ACK4WH_00795 [Phycisphaerales bacterium]